MVRLRGRCIVLLASLACSSAIVLRLLRRPQVDQALEPSKPPRTPQEEYDAWRAPRPAVLRGPAVDALPVHVREFARYGSGAAAAAAKGMDTGHESLFLGIQTSCSFLTEAGQCRRTPSGCRCRGGPLVRPEDSGFPPLSDHTFEWLDMIAAMEQSTNCFTMLELGAGWCKWSVDAVGLGRASGRCVRAIGVEAQPSHCAFARQHINSNHAASNVSIVCAAVSSEDGTVDFPAPVEGGAYGNGLQLLLDGKKQNRVIELPALSICSLLARFGGEPVDFVSLDVQSFEYAILSPTPEHLDCLARSVRVMHISLHRVEENDARTLTQTLVGELGWELIRYHCMYTCIYYMIIVLM